jgi:outer membrane protein OmpA-like peptidoglycan-associated protein
MLKTITTLIIVFGLPLYGQVDDCQRAKQLYRMGNAAEMNSEKIQLYQKSISLCPSVGAYYMLGLTYMKMDRFNNAVKPLEQAVKLDITKAEAFFLLGDAYMELNRIEDALFNFKAGLALKKSPFYQKRCNQMKIKLMEKGTNTTRIQRFLERGIKFRAKGGSAVPSIDIRVHFDFDKHSLSSKGIEEAHELGKALKNLLVKYNPRGIENQVTPFKPAVHRFKFKLIGHTDSRGTYAYNDTLSIKRAETVKFFLIEHYEIMDDVIEIEGKGKREMLIPNAGTEKEHAKNRRVEIVVIQQ